MTSFSSSLVGLWLGVGALESEDMALEPEPDLRGGLDNGTVNRLRPEDEDPAVDEPPLEREELKLRNVFLSL